MAVSETSQHLSICVTMPLLRKHQCVKLELVKPYLGFAFHVLYTFCCPVAVRVKTPEKKKSENVQFQEFLNFNINCYKLLYRLS